MAVSNSLASGKATAKSGRPLVWALSRLRGRWRQLGSIGGREWARYARRCRAKAQLLKGLGIQLPCGIQAMRFLKLSHGLNGSIIPLPAWLPCVRPVFSQRLLDFGNAIGSRGFLAALAPPVSSRRFLPVCVAPRGGALLCRCALRMRGTGERTRRRRQEQRQGQVRGA
jgi:hypothetical protein